MMPAGDNTDIIGMASRASVSAPRYNAGFPVPPVSPAAKQQWIDDEVSALHEWNKAEMTDPNDMGRYPFEPVPQALIDMAASLAAGIDLAEPLARYWIDFYADDTDIGSEVEFADGSYLFAHLLGHDGKKPPSGFAYVSEADTGRGPDIKTTDMAEMAAFINGIIAERPMAQPSTIVTAVPCKTEPERLAGEARALSKALDEGNHTAAARIAWHSSMPAYVANAQIRSRYGHATPLHRVADARHNIRNCDIHDAARAARCLIACGAGPAAANAAGLTPLHIAVSAGSEAMVRAVCDGITDPDGYGRNRNIALDALVAADKYGRRPVDMVSGDVRIMACGIINDAKARLNAGP